MKYIDRVYGEFEITEPVILELIGSPSLQRLKHIDQAGYKPLWAKPETVVPGYDHSRFAHSVGVYLLLYKYQATVEEQIAGLLHDISHSAFSHCIDYILDGGSEKEHSHQDNMHDSFVKNSEIPAVLKKYGFDIDYLLDDKNFPLKENNLPDICADRIDYSLKTAVIFGEINREEVTYLLDNLIVENNQWVFKNFESAKKYAELFLRLNNIYYCNLASAVMFRAVGDCLKHSLEKGYITEGDLYKTDDEVIDEVKKHLKTDTKLRILWDRMNGKIKAKNNAKYFEAEVFCKSRVIDPLFKQNNIFKRVSEQDTDWVNILNEESIPKHYFLKFDL